MIAFTVSLTSNDWDRNIRGWRCPVLQIPGAQVDAIYAGRKLDDACYQVNPAQCFIRWGSSEEPPESAAAEITLTQPLSRKKERDFWQAFGLIVPIITVALTVGGNYATEQMKQNAAAAKAEKASDKPADATTDRVILKAGDKASATAPRTIKAQAGTYEKWSVQGRAQVLGGEAQNYEIKAKIFPPDVPMNHPEGVFATDIPVERDEQGVLRFPWITFDTHRKGYVPVTVDLDRTRSRGSAAGASQAEHYRVPTFDLEFDDEKKRITIGKTIQIVKEKAPYPDTVPTDPAAKKRPALFRGRRRRRITTRGARR